MDAFFKMIDRILHSVPPEMQRSIRLGALIVWGVLVVFVVVWSFNAGQESAPQSGEDLYLSNIKEKVYRDRMQKKPADVTLPDLNELNKEEVAPLAVYEPEPAARSEEAVPTELEPLPMQDDAIFSTDEQRPAPGPESPVAPPPALLPLDP